MFGFGYDVIDAIGDRYDKIYSQGTEMDRSFYQNVGKIVNKQAFSERPDEIANQVFEKVDKIISGEK